LGSGRASKTIERMIDFAHQNTLGCISLDAFDHGNRATRSLCSCWGRPSPTYQQFQKAASEQRECSGLARRWPTRSNCRNPGGCGRNLVSTGYAREPPHAMDVSPTFNYIKTELSLSVRRDRTPTGLRSIIKCLRTPIFCRSTLSFRHAGDQFLLGR
jgi:hypothetical protein